MHETISAKTSCESKTNSLDRPPARRREASYMDRSFYLVGSMLAKTDCVASIRICPKTVLSLKQTWKPRLALGGWFPQTGLLGRWFSQPINAKQSSFHCFHLTFEAAMTLLFFLLQTEFPSYYSLCPLSYHSMPEGKLNG